MIKGFNNNLLIEVSDNNYKTKAGIILQEEKPLKEAIVIQDSEHIPKHSKIYYTTNRIIHYKDNLYLIDINDIIAYE